MKTPLRDWFLMGCIVEGGLGGVALALGWFFDFSPFENLSWNFTDLLLGIFVTTPMLGLFWLTLHSKSGPLSEIRLFSENYLRPLFESWSVWKLAVLSILAGIGEELLFRGFIQGILDGTTDTFLAVAFSGLLFGCFHMVTPVYAIVTACIGWYLGWLWIWSGNLLVPIVAHAAYDFIALVYFLKFHPPMPMTDMDTESHADDF